MDLADYERKRGAERLLAPVTINTYTKSVANQIAQGLSMAPTERTEVEKQVKVVMAKVEDANLTGIEVIAMKQEITAMAADWGADHSKLAKCNSLRPVVEAILACAFVASRTYSS